MKQSDKQAGPQLVELWSPYDNEFPLARVVTSDPSEVAKLKQRGAQKGYEVRVTPPASLTFEAAWRLLDAL